MWPDAVPFALADGASSPVLDDLIGGPAAALTAVALVATPEARASGWAARAAAALAAGWQGGRHVVLADLDLEQPTLHEVAGVANEEGVVDLIDYGVSLEKLVRRVPGAAFDVVTAGLFALDPPAVLRHDAWQRVLGDVAASRSTLLAYVPAAAEGADAVIRRTGAVIVLAEGDEGAAIVERLPHPYSVLAILHPAPPEPEVAAPTEPVEAETQPAEPEPEPEADEEPIFVLTEQDIEVAEPVEAPEAVVGDVTAEADAALPPPEPVVGDVAAEADAATDVRDAPTGPESRDALIHELRERQRAARLAGAAAAPAAPLSMPEPGADETDEDEEGDDVAIAPVVPATAGDVSREVELETRADAVGLGTMSPPPRRRKARSPYRHALAWTGGVVLLASLLAGAWHFLGARLMPPEPVATAPEPSPAPEAPAAPLAEDALPFVVAMEAHRDLLTAAARVADLAEIEPGLAFHIEPLERDGVLFYHVMGGPVPDSATALALRDTLIARGHKTGITPTDIRATPLAYLIGDYATAEAAEEQVGVLRALDLPGYVLQASAADGQPLFRLYVGGFGGEAEAGPVGQMLRAAGIRDTLVTRTGALRFGALQAPPDTMTSDSSATGSITP